MDSDSIPGTRTHPVDPSPAPPMMRTATFYLNPSAHTHQHKFPLTSSLRWTMNHPNNSSLNPVLHFGSTPSWAIENSLNNTFSPNQEENNNNNNEQGSEGLIPVEPAIDVNMEKDTKKPDEPVDKKGKEIKRNSKSKIFLRLSRKEKDSNENSDADDGDSDNGEDCDGEGEKEEEEAEMEFSFEDEESNFPFVKTWNLRPRKPLTKKGNNNDGSGRLKSLASKPRPPSSRSQPPRAAALDNKAMTMVPQQKKPWFSVCLTKEEIEEDFMKLTGAKPPKKLKKRPRLVQKQLDGCFPGKHLDSVAFKLFRVLDPPL